MRTNFKTALGAPIGLALSLTAAGAGAQNLVTNGNFATTTGYGQIGYNTTVSAWTVAQPSPGTDGYTFLFNSSNATTGVTGYYGNLALWGPGNGVNNGLGPSPVGGNFVGMDGAYEVGALQQTISGLVAGQQYSVGFYYAAAQQEGYTGNTTEQWDVSLGSQTDYTPVIGAVSEGFSGWQYASLAFTATGSTEVLSFLANGTPSGVPPFALLDGVTMTAVPEPTSAAMLVSGLAGLGGLAWRRRRAQKTASESAEA